jgi:hypothetical protein
VSVEVDLVKLPRLDLHDLDLFQVLFVVEAIAQNISERAKCAFQSVGGCLFLCLLEGCRFAFAVLDGAVANVLLVLEKHWKDRVRYYLMKSPVLQRDPYNNRQPQADLAVLRILIDLHHQHAPAYSHSLQPT